MDKKMNELLNRQLNGEFYSAYYYLAMSTYFSDISMDGFSKYMQTQAKEELYHAQKVYDYMNLRNEEIRYHKIEAPDTSWVNTLDVIKSAESHEKLISNQITEAYEYAKEIKDYPSVNFLNWFIDEQVEEESKFRQLKEKIKSFEGSSCTLEHINIELKKAEPEQL